MVGYRGKPYWRVKKNGKWTWQAAKVYSDMHNLVYIYKLLEEEE